MPAGWHQSIVPCTPPDAGERHGPRAERGREDDGAASLRAARLPWLMDIAGPEGRTELLDQFLHDLARAQDGLREGLEAGDSVRLGGACHVLISLAGTLGDSALTARIQGMVRRLQAGRPPFDGSGGQVDLYAALDALRAEIDAARHGLPDGPRAPRRNATHTGTGDATRDGHREGEPAGGGGGGAHGGGEGAPQ